MCDRVHSAHPPSIANASSVLSRRLPEFVGHISILTSARGFQQIEGNDESDSVERIDTLLSMCNR